MNDMLSRSRHLPERSFDPGHVLVREGDPAAGLWILVSGSLQVHKGAVLVNTIAQPGAVVGEMSVLLGKAYSATVTVSQTSVLRHATDGAALLASDPAITRLVAVGLAERLDFVTTYLADLQQQYGGAPGLSMVSDVLRELSQRQAPAVRAGSAREPDPLY